MSETPRTPEDLSAVFAREPRPQVSQPNSPWTLILGLGGAVVVGVTVFTSLSSARQAHASAQRPKSAAMPAVPAWAAGVARLAEQDAQPPPQPVPQAPMSRPPTPPPTTPDLDPSEPHWRAPAVVVDLSEAGGPAPARLAQAQTPTPTIAAGTAGAPTAEGVGTAEERFAARVAGGGAETARATQMRELSRIVPQGFVIPAVLETAIDSDLPGSVRAVVSRDVRGFDGSQVLIPRGSKLIGQYKSAAAIGQTRAFVVWSRIITPGGVSIDVGSPATDRLGRGGLEGSADSHFFQRFGASILLSVITIGTEALVSHGGGNNNALIIGSPTQAQNVAAIALQKQIDIPTTIRVAQGSAVQVSVARDLDFSRVDPQVTAGVYLDAYLAPLAQWLARPDVTDVLINRPCEVWIETTAGVMSREPADQLTEQALQRLARQIAAASHQGVNREQPLLSATLPDGARVQVVGPPATRAGLAMAVRKHLLSDMSLDDLASDGLFEAAARVDPARDAAADATLNALLDDGQPMAFLRAAVAARKTIVVSGGTGSGKTTLLNALVKEVARTERLVVIEDAPEIRLDHPNAVGLVAVRGGLGEAQVDADALLAAALRLRPDRILLGELRGAEAFAFLRAVNSGHPGSITTVHADSPAGALDQIALLALTSGVDLGWEKVRAYVERVVDVVVQLDRTGGARRMTQVLFRPSAG